MVPILFKCGSVLYMYMKEGICILIDKDDKFDVCKNVQTFREIIEQQILKAPVGTKQVEDQDVLDADAFNLLEKQLNYDEKVFSNWQKKCSTVNSSRHYAQREWKLQRLDKTRVAPSPTGPPIRFSPQCVCMARDRILTENSPGLVPKVCQILQKFFFPLQCVAPLHLSMDHSCYMQCLDNWAAPGRLDLG